MRYTLLAGLVLVSMLCLAREAEVNLTPGAVARPGLLEDVLAADAALFKAFFDDCDAGAVRRLVTDDFEMFHDKGERSITSGEQFPLNNYGAIETGVHRFYAITKGKPNQLTEVAQFTHVWREENGQLRLARVLSYDHVLAKPGAP